MKTVKFFLGAMALAVVSMVAAPAVNAQENKDAEGNTIRHPYLTNGLWDNWFVNVNPVGLNLFYDGGEWATGYAIDVNVGKWVTPCVGARVGFNGITGMDAKYGYLHGDAMWNISNAIGGYKESRIWDFVPYAHAGLLVDKPIAGKELAVGAGLLNVVRLSKRVDLTLDVRGTVYKRQGPAGFISTALGLSFNLGRTDWTRASEYHNPADLDKISAAEAAAAALTAANAALAADKAKLEKANENLQTEKAQLTESVKVAAESANGLKDVAPASFFFEIGKTELSAKELKHLDFYLANVLPNVKNGKATVVTGTADSNTGYAKRNEYLSKKRAEYMINLLKEKGIATENIVVKNAVVKAASGQAAFDRAVVVSFE
ncbi:MAG: OmpA family protein [Bacteroidales bacterium]|nr:OmpA family protein [Bacteroidales bacterium]